MKFSKISRSSGNLNATNIDVNEAALFHRYFIEPMIREWRKTTRTGRELIAFVHRETAWKVKEAKVNWRQTNVSKVK